MPQDNGDSTYDLCNLYKVGVAGNVDTSNPQFIKGKIYDRNCPNFLPVGPLLLISYSIQYLMKDTC